MKTITLEQAQKLMPNFRSFIELMCDLKLADHPIARGLYKSWTKYAYPVLHENMLKEDMIWLENYRKNHPEDFKEKE